MSIVGKMRTGKSCLFNRLLGLPGRGVFNIQYSLEWMPQFRAAHKAFGYGLNLSSTKHLTVLSSSSTLRGVIVCRRTLRMMLRFSRSPF